MTYRETANRRMFRVWLIALVGVPLVVLQCAAYPAAGEQQNGGEDFVDPAVTITTNVHYSGKYCLECHTSSPIKGGDPHLRRPGDFSFSCRCHGYTTGTYIHPVDIVPSSSKKTFIPPDFPLYEGKITCATCHAIGLQCQENESMRHENPAFLRGAPYSSRTGICLRCHEQGKYRMFDPHNQHDEKGQIIPEKCLYCHVEVPDVAKATYRQKGVHGQTVQFIGDLQILCHRCHFRQSRLHPINAEHFREPSKKIFAAMKETERLQGIILPLTQDGRITCATCHNPHERGVIPKEKAAAGGASEKYRLRVPGQSGQMCLACHRK